MALTKISGEVIQSGINIGIVTASTINVGSAVTIHTGGFRVGTSDLHSTGISVINVNSTGVITARNGVVVSSGNVLIGTETSTETASQPLQVSGGAYVSGNLGIGTTNPQTKLEIGGVLGFTDSNTKIGNVSTGSSITTGSNNNFIGVGAGQSTTTGSDNIFIGQNAGNNNQTGTGNVIIGKDQQTPILNGSNQLVIGSGFRAWIYGNSSSNVGIGVTNPSSKLTVAGQFQSTANNNNINGGGQIYLNGGTGNRIDFAGVGTAAPRTKNSILGRSEGTKIVLSPSVYVASHVDYAVGIETNALWHSVPSSEQQFKWYAGITTVATLFGTGELVVGSATSTGTASQPLQVTGGAYVSGSIGIGITSPGSILHLSSSSSEYLRIQNTTAANTVYFGNSSGNGIIQVDGANSLNIITNSTERLRITSAGHMLPGSDNTYDLGASETRWRNIYTADLQMSNEGSKNDVDGTWGKYTIQEGENDLFLINRRTGKIYKFLLEEVK